MASYAKDGKAKLYLSHTQDKKKNPLSYDQKIFWAKKAFEPKIDVVESEAKTVIDVFKELYASGIKNIIYVGGADRIGGDEDISNMILKYNGQPNKKGEIVYDFDTIQFKSAGARDDNSSDLLERASASLARKYVQENDLESFKEIVPFEDSDAVKLFNQVKAGLGITENLNEAYEDEVITIDGKEYTIKKGGVTSYDVRMGKDHYITEWEEGGTAKIEFKSLNLSGDATIHRYHENRVQFKIGKYTFNGVQGSEGRGKSAENTIGSNNKFIEALKKAIVNNEAENVAEVTLVDGEVKQGSNNSKLGGKWVDAFKPNGLGDIEGEEVADNTYMVHGITKDGKQFSEKVNVSIKMSNTPAIINFGLSTLDSPTITKPFLTDAGENSIFGTLCNKVIDAIQGKAAAYVLNGHSSWYYTIDSGTKENVNNIIDTQAMLNFIRNSYRKGYYLAWMKSDGITVENIKDVVDRLTDITIKDASITQTTIYVQFNSGGDDYALNIRRRYAGGRETAEVRINTSVKDRKGEYNVADHLSEVAEFLKENG